MKVSLFHGGKTMMTLRFYLEVNNDAELHNVHTSQIINQEVNKTKNFSKVNIIFAIITISLMGFIV